MAPKGSEKYSWKDVALHNSSDSLWISVRGKVYDVTEFSKTHPGGRDVLALNSGRDCTQLFEAYHSLSTATLLPKYEIGDLVDSEHPVYPPMSEFYRTLKTRVEAHFVERGTTARTSPRLLLISMAMIISFFMLYHLALTTSSLVVLLVASCVCGWLSAMISLIPVHEGSHAALTHSPWIWRLLGASHDFANGASFYNWLHQHFLGHHPYTNVEGVDPDIHTNDPDVRRIKRSQPRLPMYRLQALYAPVLYGLLAAKFRLQDITIITSTRMNGAIRVNPPGPWHAAVFWLGKAWFLLYRFVLPPLLLGTSLVHVAIAGMVVDAIASYYLAIVFQVNHVVGEAEFFKVRKGSDGRDEVETDWATSQVLSTVDYAHDSPLTVFLSGALSMQVVHHLFPGVSQAHYPEIAPIVRRTCKEFNVPYVVLPDFTTALKAHLGYLWDLGHTD